MLSYKTQYGDGVVSNTVSQTGQSVGLAVTALVANQVTRNSENRIKDHPTAVLEEYHALLCLCVDLASVILRLSVWGLRKIGKVGKK